MDKVLYRHSYIYPPPPCVGVDGYIVIKNFNLLLSLEAWGQWHLRVPSSPIINFELQNDQNQFGCQQDSSANMCIWTIIETWDWELSFVDEEDSLQAQARRSFFFIYSRMSKQRTSPTFLLF
jgi:hypothetical protein